MGRRLVEIYRRFDFVEIDLVGFIGGRADPVRLFTIEGTAELSECRARRVGSRPPTCVVGKSLPTARSPII